MRQYKPPFFLWNAHLETIFPAVFRRVEALPYEATRIVTPDDDFLEVFAFRQHAQRAVIISHGLEGNAWRPYMKGMALACFQQGADVYTWNFRGCGDDMNLQLRFYHSGATEDLSAVIEHVVSLGYDELYLIGFSLGGNMTLKYLGEQRTIRPEIKKAVAFSVPLDLHSSCLKISGPSNRIYASRFLKSLKKKIVDKACRMEGLDTAALHAIKTIEEFDDLYTAPLHGFEDAAQYYQACSSLHFLETIPIPTLLVNARNDPFLSELCYPQMPGDSCVKTEYTSYGGHVGFTQFFENGLYWSEQRAVSYLFQNL